MRAPAWITTSIALWAVAASPGSAASLELEPCELPGVEAEARCGRYEVFEDRVARDGRKLSLHVVLLPAQGEATAPDPIVFFAGGPGGATTEMAGGLATFYKEMLEERDFLLVDYRGTGKSNPLFCPYQEDKEEGALTALETFIPIDRVPECRDALGEKANLEHYTSETIVDDVAEVARALGYRRVNLSGGSYGTRAALVFMRRHPDMVRSAILEGVVPPDARMPVSFAHDAQAALDGWFEECAADAACSSAFPDLAGTFATLLERLDSAPVQVAVSDAKRSEPVDLTITRNVFVQTIRYMLYSSMESLQIPAFLNAALEGNWKPLAQSAYSVAGSLMASLPDGLYLSVTCTEDVARIGPNAAAVQAGFLGDFRLRQQVGACRDWPQTSLAADFFDPVVSEAAVLLVSGERDPVTPARWGFEVQEFLPNSAHLVVPDGAHGWFGLEGAECADALGRQLLAEESVRNLDLEGCRSAISRPDFLLEIPSDEEVELSADQLARFEGDYAVPDGGFSVSFELTDEGLMALVGDEPPARMTPIGELRFRLQGAPPSQTFLFVEEDGAVHALRVQAGTSTLLELLRKPSN